MEAVGTAVAEVVAFTAVAEVVAFTAVAVVVAFTAAAEVVAFTAAAVEEAAISVAVHPAPALVGVDGPLARAVFAGLLLVPMARMGQAGRELTAIDLTVRGLMGCTVAGGQLHLVHVTAQCRGTGLIQG
jgi:hypothetical protein